MQTLKLLALKALPANTILPEFLLVAFTFTEVIENDICNLSWFSRFADGLNWLFITETMAMSEAMIERFANYLDWSAVAHYQHLSEAFIERNLLRIDMWAVAVYQQLSFDFVQRHESNLRLCHIFSRPQKWSDEQFGVYMQREPVIWQIQALSESFIRKNVAHVNWHFLSCAQRQWSDDFFSDFITSFSHVSLAMCAILTESQIEKLSFFPSGISSYQILSSDFIKRHADKLEWPRIASSQKLTPDLIEYIQSIQDWHVDDIALFSNFVTDRQKISQFPLLCDWTILSERCDIDEAILVANEQKVMWTHVCIQTPSDDFLSAFHQKLDPLFIAWHASERFLLSHPQYIVRETRYNLRVNSMELFDKYLSLLDADFITKTRYLTTNFIKKNRHRLDARIVRNWQLHARHVFLQ